MSPLGLLTLESLPTARYGSISVSENELRL